MISPESIAYLRCPIDPQRAALLRLDEERHLFCTGCPVEFSTRDGIPCLIPEEAILPEGTKSHRHLPCRKKFKNEE